MFVAQKRNFARTSYRDFRQWR